MRPKRNLLIGVVLGAVIGWAVGFLRLPYIERNDSFWVGLAGGVSAVLLVVAVLFVWNRNSLLIRLIGRGPTAGHAGNATRVHSLIWVFVSVFIVVGGLASSFMIYQQNRLLETQSHAQNKRVAELTEMVESIRKGNQVLLMGNVLDQVSDELTSKPDGKLSDATIARVVALSHSLKPYRYFVGDTLSDQQLSPERGQLLLALVLMGMDSSSLEKIMLKATFSKADLSGVNLSGLDLSGIDLSGANLNDADLRAANLSAAMLKKANLFGAKLDMTNLREANLDRAVMSWSDVNDADLSKAFMEGVDLRNARLRNTDLREVNL